MYKRQLDDGSLSVIAMAAELVNIHEQGMGGVIGKAAAEQMRELAALQAAFEDVVAAGGQTRVVTIVGDAGVGKSRLLYELSLIHI